jgi:2-octaprenyl-6-methoxyphenol hydroxylase
MKNRRTGKTHAHKTPADLTGDVVIVGGGLSGLTLALVLARADVDVICIDRDVPALQTATAFDGRTTAISYASHRVLQAAGVWDDMQDDCAPIMDIRVADGDHPLFLHFSSAADGKDNPFGWIIENRLMREYLFAAAATYPTLTHLTGVAAESFFADDVRAGAVLADGRRVSAPLMIGADGRRSAVREWLGINVRAWEYGQTAVVCNVAHALDHENIALEHFLPAGPFAVLPMTDDDHGRHRSSVVWTVEPQDAKRILSLGAGDVDAELQKLFGDHLGAVRHVSAPMVYPLSLMHADSYIGCRTALMAEAAHVIHPIAGQGLNLSMRDIAVLAELITDQLKLGLDPGSAHLLAQYEDWRRTDTLMMAGFTDMLNKLFSNHLKTVGALRGLGLGLVEKMGPLKGFFAGQAMGMGGKTPRIVQNGRL